MADKSNIKTVNISLASPLFLIFLVLKLTHVIDWSWWWVTAPLWIPFGFMFGFLGLAFVVAMLTTNKRKF